MKLTPTRNLLERLSEARAITDELFQIVRSDALYERPIAERHRIVFYIGHLEAFDWNLFRGERPQRESFDLGYDKLFAFGIDPVDGQLPSDQPQDWPSLVEVSRYNQRVRAELDGFLNSTNLDAAPEGSGTPLSTLLHTAIEHRLMHAETLAYMFHRLPFGRKVPQRQPGVPAGNFSPQTVDIPAGTATLGLPSDAQHFGWDNEFDAHQVHVPSFRIYKFMVTNGEYVQFVSDGGYRRPELWAHDDWQWIGQHGIEHPAFWCRDGSNWLYRGMFEALPLPPDWPVYASHAEATAYARWAGKSLPTEAQWHRAAYGQLNGTEREFPWGTNESQLGKGNFGFIRWDAAPVGAAANNESLFGAVGMLGNGWEWTSSEFAPFAGFRPFAFYPGYSANFFDGKHFVMKGGSSRTAAPLLRRSFRNWFQTHYQYVYAGFRCVTNGN
jgi:ergothioneine biosynthesis protein EgtB